MRRGHLAEIRRAVVYDKAMTISHAAVKIKFTAAEMLLHGFDYLRRLFGRDIAAGVVKHGLCAVIRLVAQSDKVAAQSDISLAHLDSDADRLKGRAAGVALLRIESEHAHICNIAAGFESSGNGPDKSYFAPRRKRIDIGLLCDFHRRLSAESLNGIIRHAVAENYSIFHISSPFQRIYAQTMHTGRGKFG